MTINQENHSRLGPITVRCTGFEDVAFFDHRRKEVGTTNGVLAEEYDLEDRRLKDEQARERPCFTYITTLPTVRRPGRIRRYYPMRWVIENQGFRELTQTWALDCLAGRRFNALNSPIAFGLILYNAERVLRMRHAGPWQKERERLRGLGERNLLGGPSLAAYTRDGRVGLLTSDEYERLIAEHERDRIVRTLKRGDGRRRTP